MLFLLPHISSIAYPVEPSSLTPPISLLSKSYPHLSNSYSLPLKTFGCTAFVHVHDHHRNKLDLRAIKTVFIGYSPTQKGYRCYYPQTGKSLSLGMSTSLKIKLISLPLHFTGGNQIQKLIGIVHPSLVLV